MPHSTNPRFRQALRALLAAACAALMGIQPAWPQDHTIIIDPEVFESLDPSQISGLIEYLAYLVPPDRWPTAPFTHADLAAFVRANYGSDNYPDVTASISRIVIRENELAEPRGSDLRIPLLPRMPATETKPGWSQVADLVEADLYSVRPGGEMTTAARRRGERPEALGAGGTWLIETDAPTLRFAENLYRAARIHPPRRLLEDPRIYVGPSTEMVLQAVFPDSEGQPVARSETAGMDLSRLTADSSFYILDFFGGDGKCSHGESVRDVVRDELGRVNALHLESNIVPVNLSFYEDKEASRREMQRFVAREYSGGAHRKLLGQIEALVRKKKRDRFEVPILFLQAVLSNIIAQDPQAVVSMSFYTKGDFFHLLPKNFKHESEGILLGAVLNSQGTVVEQAEGLEPIRTFYDQRQERNVLLVGAWDGEGKPFGMVSANGDGIAGAAPAFGYGTPRDCVWGKKGTSFASPALGVQLFLARQMWRQNGLHVSGQALRRRVALASVLSQDLVAGFASGGRLDLRRLTLDAGPFGVTHDGGVIPLAHVSGHVEYNQGEGLIRRPIAKGQDGFSGIQLIGDRLFAYSDGWSRWREVVHPTLELTVDDAAGQETLRLPGFASRFSMIGVM